MGYISMSLARFGWILNKNVKHNAKSDLDYKNISKWEALLQIMIYNFWKEFDLVTLYPWGTISDICTLKEESFILAQSVEVSTQLAGSRPEGEPAVEDSCSPPSNRETETKGKCERGGRGSQWPMSSHQALHPTANSYKLTGQVIYLRISCPHDPVSSPRLSARCDHSRLWGTGRYKPNTVPCIF